MSRSRLPAAAPLLFLLVLPGALVLGQAGVVWEDPVAVDTGIAALSNSSGVSAQWFGDRLWVFYEKSGDIYGAAHGSAGWKAPRRLTIAPGRQGDPHVCGVQVIWGGLARLRPGDLEGPLRRLDLARGVDPEPPRRRAQPARGDRRGLSRLVDGRLEGIAMSILAAQEGYPQADVFEAWPLFTSCISCAVPEYCGVPQAAAFARL